MAARNTRYPSSHRNAVAHHVQIALPKVDNAFTDVVLDIGVPNIPFLRNRPVKHLSAAWDLMQFQGNSLLEQSQALPDTLARDASADWVKGFNQSICLPTLMQRIDLLKHVAQNLSRSLGAAGRFGHHSPNINILRKRCSRSVPRFAPPKQQSGMLRLQGFDSARLFKQRPTQVLVRNRG